jgi:hypothetical protein
MKSIRNKIGVCKRMWCDDNNTPIMLVPNLKSFNISYTRFYLLMLPVSYVRFKRHLEETNEINKG